MIVTSWEVSVDILNSLFCVVKVNKSNSSMFYENLLAFGLVFIYFYGRL